MENYDSLAKVAGALMAINAAIGRLIANRADADEILDQMDAVTEMFENLAAQAEARGSLNEQAVLIDMAAGARFTGAEVGAETGEGETGQ